MAACLVLCTGQHSYGVKRIQVKSATSRLSDIQLGDKSSRRHPTRRQQRSTRNNSGQIGDKPISQLGDNVENGDNGPKYIYDACKLIPLLGNSSVTHVTFVQFFYFHCATIKHLVDQSNKFKAYDDLGVQLYITT